MASWKIITADDVSDALNGPQVTALRSAMRAPGARDPLPGLIANRVAYVRGRITKRIRVSAVAGSVPPELADGAVALILERLQTRVPALALTKDQTAQITRAYDDLDLVTKGDFALTLPDDGEFTGQSAVNVQVHRGERRQATRHSLRGM